MGFRLFRRVKIAPGLSLNFSKSGISTSLGMRGAHLTLGRRGVRKTVGIPGTGCYYTTNSSWKLASSNGARAPRAGRRAKDEYDAAWPEHNLELNFFQKLVTPADEEEFVAGCHDYLNGHPDSAFSHLSQATDIADGAFLAGFLALNQGKYDSAAQWLLTAARDPKLGELFKKYKVQMTISLPIGPYIQAQISPTRHGALLGRVEALQRLKQYQQALDTLKQMHKDRPDDPVVVLSMAELIFDAKEHPDPKLAKQIIQLIGDVENDSAVHAALMMYKAMALAILNLNTAARTLLTSALRKKKDRPEDLLSAIRYERALVYEALGHRRRCQSEMEKLYAQNPDYEDVAKRLGLK